MYQIGLTGSIATGKSTVLKLLIQLGATCIDGDEIAREAVRPGSSGLRKITKAFGIAILHSNGSLNREKLGELVFKDPVSKALLEKIIHPAIQNRLKQKLAAFKKRKINIVVLDIPLLYEVEYQNQVDEVWVVYVNEALQLTRLMKRNGYTETEALARIRSQYPIEKKKMLANVVIDNSGSLACTEHQLKVAWQATLKKFALQEDTL